MRAIARPSGSAARDSRQGATQHTPSGKKSTLTAPGCGMGEILVQDAQEKIAIIPTVADVRVQLVFDPPWNQTMMSDEARLQTGLM